MNARLLLSGIFGVASVALLIGAAQQHRQLEQLRLGPTEVHPTALPAATAPVASRAPATAPLAGVEKIELMRLRREVGELTRRRRDLASIAGENSRLKEQLAVARTNGAPTLPPGYVRAANAKFAGLATPENALESFVWAVHQRDKNAIAQVLTEEAAAGMMRELVQGGDEELANMAKMLAGFRIVERKEDGDDSVELKVEIAPGVDPAPLKLKRVGDAWRLSP